jgi:fatty-acyl-CoA synthase
MSLTAIVWAVGEAIACTPASANGRRLPFLGTPLPGLAMRIADPVTGEALGERIVGELELRGDCITRGYFRRPDLTHLAFHDDWLRTGDRAYIADGELVVCDRLKDVVIVMGRNYSPIEIERAAATVPGVRAGNVVAFGVPGHPHEQLVIIAEVRSNRHRRIRDEITKAVRNAVGVTPAEIVLSEPGALPKTSSGKLQRSLCRSDYLSDVK